MLKFIAGLFKKNYESLDGSAFKARYQATGSNAVLLDVRTVAEFKSGTIPGAVNLDVMASGFKNAVMKLDKSKEYFVFCRSGARSGTAANILAGNGCKVVNLSGGISAWKK